MQYTVLEANANVNGKSQTSHHQPSQTHEPIWILLQIIITSAWEVNLQNLVTTDSAVTTRHMWTVLFTVCLSILVT